MTFKKTAGQFIYNVAQKAFRGGKPKTTGKEVIKNFPIAKNLTTKRKIQDETVKAVDEGIKKADVPQSMKESQSTKQYASEMKRKKAKELKNYSYKLDKLTEKKAKGGRVGLKRGTGLMKKKSDIQKIKETFSPKNKSTKFGMLSVKAGIDKNPNPTQADRIAGAKMKNKKRFV